MAPRKLKRCADNWWGLSNAAINTSATTLVLASSGSAGLETPCVIHEEGKGEKILVTDIAVDTPSAGLDTLTITRGFGGTTPVSHASGARMMQWYYKEYPNDLAAKLEGVMMAFACMKGRENGVMRSQAGTEFAVTAQGTPDMTVNVAIGGAIIDDEPVGTIEATTLTFTAPVTNPRIDIVQVDQDGIVTAKTGTEAGSPSAPSVDSGNLLLATITHTTAETSIKNSNDATNGYITDARVYV